MELTAPFSQEISAKDRIVVSTKSTKKRKIPDRRPSPPKNKPSFYSKPPNVDRRRFLKLAGVGAAAGLVALFGKLFYEKQTEVSGVPEKDRPYAGWERFATSEIPQEVIVKIGQELAKSDYPGYPEVGNIVTQSQVDYVSVPQISPKLKERVKFVLADLSARGALSTFTHNTNGIFQNILVEDYQSGQTEMSLMVVVDGLSSVTVSFDKQVTDGSPAMRRLLTVKEMSTFLYMDEMRKRILDEATLLKRVDVPPEDLGDFLVTNAYYQQKNGQPSGYGFYFDNILKVLDGAGYWHVLPAYAEGIIRKDFTEDDVGSITGERILLVEAIKRELFVRQPDGKFGWRAGITPFSKEWIDVVSLVF